MNRHASESVGARPKTGPNVKAILQSLKTSANDENSRAIACNPAKMFKSLIARANDSGSMDASFEHKMLPRPSRTPTKAASYVHELRQVLKENGNVATRLDALASKKNVIDETNVTPSKLPFANRKNIEHIVVPVSAVCAKHSTAPLLQERKMPSSSTPYRSRPEPRPSPGVPPLTPLSCIRFIDSEPESPESKHAIDSDRTLVKCFSLTRSSCRRLASFRKRDKNRSTSRPHSPQLRRATTLSSSFASSRSRSESPGEASPTHGGRKIKNSKLLDLFRVGAKPQEMMAGDHGDLTLTCNNLSQFIGQFDEAAFDRMQVLSEHNVDLHNNQSLIDDLEQTINGADGQIEFSFVCEPSTSDIEDDLIIGQLTAVKCDIVEQMPSIEVIAPSIESNHSSIILSKILNSSPFRRSISDPSLVRLADPHTSSEQRRTPRRISTGHDTMSVDLHSPTRNAVSLFYGRRISSFRIGCVVYNGNKSHDFLPIRLFAARLSGIHKRNVYSVYFYPFAVRFVKGTHQLWVSSGKMRKNMRTSTHTHTQNSDYNGNAYLCGITTIQKQK